MRKSVLGLVFAGTILAWLVIPHWRSAAASQMFTETKEMIRMRDGVRLYTAIFAPTDAKQPLPILLFRTPYGMDDDAALMKGLTTGQSMFPISGRVSDLVKDGYIFVFQDIRGRFKSEGQFIMLRPPRDPNDPKAIDEATDTYDTIDWLVKHVPHNNGRAGLAGISYGGWLTAMALLDPHPALKAVSEQASPADMFIGDDFHHNGAFRLSYAFEYATALESSKGIVPFQFDDYDTYDWYLRLGPLSNVNRIYFHGKIPSWNNFVNHPNYDSFWKRQAFYPYLKNLHLAVPDLNVAGWWDQEDFYGPVEIYETLAKNDTRHFDYLIAGPWNHGGWSFETTGSSLGRIQFGSPTSEFFRAKIQAPWFAYWLKGEGTLPFKRALTFQTGSGKWISYDQWPPDSGTRKKLYFRADGRLSFDPPTKIDEREFDSYVSDPAHPVPYRHRPVEETYSEGSRWPTWLVEDQRFADSRPDVATWSTSALTSDVCVAGDIEAHLYASTTGSDSDWVTKLIDAYPAQDASERSMGGYELMIADEILRGRFRNSFTNPEPITPNRVTAYTIDLHTNSHCFLKGHRIMVQVQSTWFPLYDRNPQKYVPNIFNAVAADYVKATQRIYRSSRYPSNVEIAVTPR